MAPFREHLDKIGFGGTLLAALCCLGFPALLSVLTALGMGFLIHDAILQPLLILSLLVFLGGLVLGFRKHGRIGALLIGGIAAILLYGFVFVRYVPVIAYLSLFGLLAASLMNIRSKRTCSTNRIREERNKA